MGVLHRAHSEEQPAASKASKMCRHSQRLVAEVRPEMSIGVPLFDSGVKGGVQGMLTVVEACFMRRSTGNE